MDLASLTAKVCRIAMDAGSFLKEERKTFRSESVEKKHAQKGFLKSQRIALLEMMMGFPIGHTELAQ